MLNRDFFILQRTVGYICYTYDRACWYITYILFSEYMSYAPHPPSPSYFKDGWNSILDRGPWRTFFSLKLGLEVKSISKFENGIFYLCMYEGVKRKSTKKYLEFSGVIFLIQRCSNRSLNQFGNIFCDVVWKSCCHSYSLWKWKIDEGFYATIFHFIVGCWLYYFVLRFKNYYV